MIDQAKSANKQTSLLSEQVYGGDSLPVCVPRCRAGDLHRPDVSKIFLPLLTDVLLSSKRDRICRSLRSRGHACFKTESVTCSIHDRDPGNSITACDRCISAANTASPVVGPVFRTPLCKTVCLGRIQSAMHGAARVTGNHGGCFSIPFAMQCLGFLC